MMASAQAMACSFFLLHTMLILCIGPFASSLLSSEPKRPLSSQTCLSSRPSQKPPFFQARIALAGDDDVVEHLDAHEPARVDQPPREAHIVIRRLGVVGWV